jgi:hypothetical protein
MYDGVRHTALNDLCHAPKKAKFNKGEAANPPHHSVRLFELSCVADRNVQRPRSVPCGRHGPLFAPRDRDEGDENSDKTCPWKCKEDGWRSEGYTKFVHILI